MATKKTPQKKPVQENSAQERIDPREFEHEESALCGLCGNRGTIDTIKTGLTSPAGAHCGVQRFCICANGRAWKRGGANLAALVDLVHARTKKLTPEEFEEQVRGFIRETEGDPEAFHGRTDDAMEDLLTSLGYGAGVSLIKNTTRW